MSTSPINPRHLTVDGVRIRYAESEPNGEHGLLLSPWPESMYAFEPIWSRLAREHHLVAVDLPGFGGSESRPDLFTPSAMGDFLVGVLDKLGLDRVHVVGPDIGTSAALFAAAAAPERFQSILIGSGGSSVPLELGEPLTTWVAATDLTPYQDGRSIIEFVLENIFPASPLPEHVREDYLASYDGTRFAESMAYVRSYPTELVTLRDRLPDIHTPVRLIAGRDDTAIPPSNAEFLADRLPKAKLDIVDAGHFVWEQNPAAYVTHVLDWWAEHRSERQDG